MNLELRISHFPYCVCRTKDGRYILLNRDYKPLGHMTSDHVVYETHPSTVALNITPAIAAKMSVSSSEATQMIHLYDDRTVPTASAANMKAYLTRLAVLIKLKHKVT